jgi:uncharacterized membrane protein
MGKIADSRGLPPSSVGSLAGTRVHALERLIGQFSVPVLHDVLTRIIAAAGAGGSQIASAIVGVIGALVGTFGGYHIRHTLVKRAHLPDLAVALAEDFIAIAGGLLIVSHL